MLYKNYTSIFNLYKPSMMVSCDLLRPLQLFGGSSKRGGIKLGERYTGGRRKARGGFRWFFCGGRGLAETPNKIALPGRR